jgi:hypothetical protein
VCACQRIEQGDHSSDTSSDAAAPDNGSFFGDPHMFRRRPDYRCHSNCLGVLALAESHQTKITLDVAGYARN